MTCPRRVFLLWMQGWDKAPELVQKTRQSWILHNPGWDIVCLNQTTLMQWVDTEKLPYQNMSIIVAADLVRLNLLATHGGVWADATMLCVRPLDGWIDEAMAPEGFWMYHGRDEGRGPASWFMASVPGSKIITRWLAGSNELWSQVSGGAEYFWMDRVFSRLLESDKDLLSSWRRVPYINCNERGGAHALADRVFNPFAPSILEAIQENLPFAIKLNWRGECVTTTNAWHVIDWALHPRFPSAVTWGERPSLDHADFFSTAYPRRIFLDCGTNLIADLEALTKAVRIRESWLVHSFEANPGIYQSNLRKNTLSFVTFHNAAVWINDGTVTLHTKAASPGAGTDTVSSVLDLLPLGQGTDDGRRKTSQEVPCIDLAKYIQDHFRDDDELVVRMNIEGAEYAVLEHLLATNLALRRIRILYVKFHADYFANSKEMKKRERQLVASIKKSHPGVFFTRRRAWFVGHVWISRILSKLRRSRHH